MGHLKIKSQISFSVNAWMNECGEKCFERFSQNFISNPKQLQGQSEA